MSKYGKLVNVLHKNLDLASKWHNGIPDCVEKEIYDIDAKIRELKWTIYDD